MSLTLSSLSLSSCAVGERLVRWLALIPPRFYGGVLSPPRFAGVASAAFWCQESGIDPCGVGQAFRDVVSQPCADGTVGVCVFLFVVAGGQWGSRGAATGREARAARRGAGRGKRGRGGQKEYIL